MTYKFMAGMLMGYMLDTYPNLNVAASCAKKTELTITKGKTFIVLDFDENYIVVDPSGKEIYYADPAFFEKIDASIRDL